MHHLPLRPATPACAIPHPSPDLVQLHTQAVHGLNAALHQLTSPGIDADKTAFTRALARSIRVTTVLKRACACIAVNGVTPVAVAAMATLSGIASLSLNTSGSDQ